MPRKFNKLLGAALPKKLAIPGLCHSHRKLVEGITVINAFLT